MKETLLKVENLRVTIGKKEILHEVCLTLKKGEIHVIMGPNGSGKSTLANVVMGNPRFTVAQGKIYFKDQDITELEPEERAKLGMFMAFQYPKEISGVQMDRFLFTAFNNLQKAKNSEFEPMSIFIFNKKIENECKILKMNPELSSRSINEGFSGGEKKKAEMLQLGVLEPEFAILDETDSGLDVDALKIVGEAINRFRGKDKSIFLVTHYQRILQYLRPDCVHVMVHGRIVKSGGAELAEELEREGYEKYINSKF